MLQVKRKIQIDPFGLAIKDWLSGDISGHLGPYMYTEDTDDKRWKKGHSADSYYLGRDDKTTFDIALKDLNVLAENFFDLGPGGVDSVATKSIPIAQQTLTANYWPIDFSPILASISAEKVAKELSINATPVIADFFEPLPLTKPNSLIALMGGTLGNLETHKNTQSLKARLTQIFSIYRRLTTQSGFFFVSFDANTNGKEILDCYTNDQLGHLVYSCIDRAIDTDKFEYQVNWTPENYQLALGLRSKQDQIIHFDGEEFAIEQDEFLSVLNSYRFPVEFIKDAAVQAKWTHLKTWSATNRVHYLLFMAS